MSTQICPSCRTTNVLIARFCDECGTPLDASGARVLSIGSAPDNDVVLDYPIISAHHARVVLGPHPQIEDLGSTNGTAVGRPENKVGRHPLTASDNVYFGSLRVPAARLLGGKLAMGAEPHDTLRLEKQVLVLGRDPECDMPVEHPTISWHHARLQRSGGRVILEDLGSTNGTFVNGSRVDGQTEVHVGDVIALGSSTFRLRAPDQLERRSDEGNMTLEVRDLTVDVPGKRLIEGASFVIYPGELVGLMGPSGAGKTTLMLAMNGYTPPSYGQVLWNGRDLYAHFDQFRTHIGYVPQDDIMHGDLTVWQALYYSARLRLPRDMRKSEIEDRIRKVLAQLGLQGTEDVLIGSASKKGVSGGQRKRVNLAMELLTDPSVLFLDEPTSGLSSEDALTVMTVLRELADRGKTILITIHQPSLEVFRQMDNLVLLGKDAGSPDPAGLAYFGPAYPDSVRFFHQGSRTEAEPLPDRLLEGLKERSAREWIAAYRRSSFKRRYVDQRVGTLPAAEARNLSRPPAGGTLLQWKTLTQRSLAIKVRDLANTAILLVQAPIIALLIVLVFGADVKAEMTQATWQAGAAATATTLFLLTISALWFGCSNSAREIVAEWAIYHRERMINLALPAYVGSKVTVLGALCVVQCCALMAIVYRGCGLDGPWRPMLAVLVLTSLVGMGLGLVLSARAGSSEVAISLVPIVLLPMVILGGIMQPLHKMGQPGETLADAMASRWSFEAMLMLESDERPRWPLESMPPESLEDLPPQEERDVAERYFPTDERSARPVPVAALAVMFALLVTIILWILRSRDVHR